MNQQMRNKQAEAEKAVWKLTPEGNYACGICGNEPKYSGFINDYKYCPFCGNRIKKYQLATYTPHPVINTYEM